MTKRIPSKLTRSQRDKVNRESREDRRNTPLLIRKLISGPSKQRHNTRAQNDKARERERDARAARRADHRPPRHAVTTLPAHPSPHPKHSPPWRLERSLLLDAKTQKHRTLKELGQADKTLLKIEEERNELVCALAGSHDQMDLELLNLQHTIVLKVKARAQRDVAHASDNITNVIRDINLAHEQHLLQLAESPPPPPASFQQGHNQLSRLPQSLPPKNQDEPEGKSTKLTLADKVEIIRLRDSPHASSTILQLARDFKVPFHRHSTFCI